MNCKIVVFGSGAVGKTAVIIHYIQGYFVCDFDPGIGSEYIKPVEIDGVTGYLDIIDTYGMEDYSVSAEIRNGDGFILMYSITDRYSFEQIEHLHTDIVRLKDRENVPCAIFGNKSDKTDERVVSTSEGEELASRLHCKFFEGSALTNMNIDQVFTDVVKDIMSEKKPTDGKTRKKKSQPHNECCHI